MADDPSLRLRAVLAELRRVPDILGATIARRDGILIAHALPKSMDPKKIAAMSAAIVGTSEMAAGEMGLGTFSQSIVDTDVGKMRATVESEEGKLLSLGAGEEALLVALVYDDANLGLVLIAMERAAKQVEEILRGAG